MTTPVSPAGEGMPHVGEDSGHPRTAIIVSGMHRSGTSAITRVVSLLGAGLPNDIIDAGRDNERGFWESRVVIDLNESALRSFDSWWGGWQSVDAQRLVGSESLLDRARQLIREGFSGQGLVVLKDPRVSRLLPLWQRAFDDEGFRCVHILALRHPGAVAGSLGDRNGLSPEASTLSWLAHSLDAEQHTRGDPRVVVSFENMLRGWRSEIDRVARALGVEWPERTEQVAADIDGFIEPGLAHQAPAEVPSGPVARVAPVYDVLRRWAADDPRPDDEATIDAWRALLAPLRLQRSPVALVARERQKLIDEIRSNDKWPGKLASPRKWRPIQNEAFNVEAEAAWFWLMRELEHAASATRAGLDGPSESLTPPRDRRRA